MYPLADGLQPEKTKLGEPLAHRLSKAAASFDTLRRI